MLGTLFVGRLLLRELCGFISGFRAFFLAPLGIGGLNLTKYGSWAGTYICVYVRIYVYVCMCVYVCMYVCMYMYVYMYVCMYVPWCMIACEYVSVLHTG